MGCCVCIIATGMMSVVMIREVIEYISNFFQRRDVTALVSLFRGNKKGLIPSDSNLLMSRPLHQLFLIAPGAGNALGCLDDCF